MKKRIAMLLTCTILLQCFQTGYASEFTAGGETGLVFDDGTSHSEEPVSGRLVEELPSDGAIAEESVEELPSDGAIAEEPVEELPSDGAIAEESVEELPSDGTITEEPVEEIPSEEAEATMKEVQPEILEVQEEPEDAETLSIQTEEAGTADTDLLYTEELINGNFTYTIVGNTEESKTVRITAYSGDEAVVSIPSAIDGYPVTAVERGLFVNHAELTCLYLPDTITYLGERFIAGTSITSITIPGSLTGAGRYGLYIDTHPLNNVSGALTGCTTLKTVIIEEGVKSIPAYFCYGLTGLEQVLLPDSVDEIERFAFARCPSLKELSLPKAPLELKGGVFYEAGLNSIEIPKDTTASMFTCNDFVYYPLSAWHGSGTLRFEEGTTVIKAYLCGESAPANVEIPDTVTEIENHAFYNAEIDHITIPGNVKKIGARAFYGCAKLTSVTMGEGIQEIGTEAFSCCSSLSRLILPSTVKTVGHSLIEATAITSFTIPVGLEAIDNKYTLTKSLFSGCSTLEEVILIDGLERIPPYLCKGMSSLVQTVRIPSSVTEIGSYAFEDSGLASVVIPGSVKQIQNGAFQGCGELTSCVMEEGVEAISNYAFSDCEKLTQVSLPDSLQTVGYWVFKGAGLKILTIPGGITQCQTSVDHFISFLTDSSVETVRFPEGTETIPAYVCAKSNIRELVLPDSIKTIKEKAFWDTDITALTLPEGVETVEAMAFSGCTFLTNVIFPDSLKEIGSSAFMGTKLTALSLPDTLKSIGANAFKDLQTLETVIFRPIPGKLPRVTEVTSKEVKDDDLDSHTMELTWSFLPEQTLKLDKQAFSGCTALKSVTLPKNLHSIGMSCFSNNTSLSIIRYPGTEEEWGHVSVENDNESIMNAEITYVPEEDPWDFTGFDVQISTHEEFRTMQTERILFMPGTVTADTTVEDLIQKATIKAEEKEKNYFIRIRTYRMRGTSPGVVLQPGSWSDTCKLTVENFVSAEEIRRAVLEFYKCMEEYLEAVQKEARADKQNYKSNAMTKGKALKAADDASEDRLINFRADISLSEIQKLSVYNSLADYMEKAGGLTIDKIDTSSDEKIQKGLKKVMDAIQENIEKNSGIFSYSTSSGTVRFQMNGIAGSIFGYIYLNGTWVGGCTSGMKNTWKALTEYVKNLEKVVDDLMYQVLESVFVELLSVTGITNYVNSELEERLKNCVDEMRKAGYGDLLKRFVQLKECNSILQDIKKAAGREDLAEALKDVEGIWKKIEGLDFSDTSVKKSLIKSMTGELEAQRKDLAKLLYAYAFDKEKEEPASKVIKAVRKFFVSCPVDVAIYDESGNVIGSIQNGKASYQPEVTMVCNGSTKQFWLDSEKTYTIELTGTGQGTMHYVMQDLKGMQVADQVDFFDIPLEEGIIYRQTLTGGSLENAAAMMPLVEAASGSSSQGTGHFDANGDTCYVTVECITAADAGGTVSVRSLADVVGTGDQESVRVEAGTQVCVKATPAEGYRFTGWYLAGTSVEETPAEEIPSEEITANEIPPEAAATEEDLEEGEFLQEEMISADAEYYLAAVKDVKLEARFAKMTAFHPDLGIQIAPGYREDIRFFIVKDGEEGTEAVGDKIVLYQDSKEESISIILKKYPADGGEPFAELIVLTRENTYKYAAPAGNLSLYAKVDIAKEDGTLMATILPKGEIPPENCQEGNHCWEAVSQKAATCTEAGHLRLVCSQCGQTQTMDYPASGHSYGEWETVKEATYTEPGKKTRKCTACGSEDPEKKVLTASGHSYGEWETVKEATCTEPGKKTRKCTVCGSEDPEKKVLTASGHSYGEWETVTEATVFEAKMMKRKCSICGAEESRSAGTKLKATAEINATSIPLKLRQTFNGLKITGLADGDYIRSWKSSNTRIVKVNKKGKLTAGRRTGKATVTVTLGSGLTKKIRVTVQKKTVKTRKLTVEEKRLTLKKGARKSIVPIVTPLSSQERIKYVTSSKRIASVNAKGVVIAKKPGSTRITVISGKKKITVTVKVTK